MVSRLTGPYDCQYKAVADLVETGYNGLWFSMARGHDGRIVVTAV